MNFERGFLISFFGNYLINTVVAALVALVPVSQDSTAVVTPQYITFLILAAVLVALLTWWYMKGAVKGLQSGILFGVLGFVMAIAVAFVTGVSGVLGQTGSFQSVIQVLPNFWPFLWNWSTLWLLLYWVIPAGAIGWWLGGMGAMKSPTAAPQRPMGSM